VIEDAGDKGFRDQLFDVNQKYFAAVLDGLHQYGFRIAADAPPPVDVPGWLDKVRRITIAWAAGSAAILLLLLWFPAWPRGAWWTLRIVNVLAAIGAGFVSPLVCAGPAAGRAGFPLLGFLASAVAVPARGAGRNAVVPRGVYCWRWRRYWSPAWRACWAGY